MPSNVIMVISCRSHNGRGINANKYEHNTNACMHTKKPPHAYRYVRGREQQQGGLVGGERHMRKRNAEVHALEGSELGSLRRNLEAAARKAIDCLRAQRQHPTRRSWHHGAARALLHRNASSCCCTCATEIG